MRNLLISGLGIKHDVEDCFPCNFDHQWLITYPSLLLWSNKILIPKTIWTTISEERYPDSKELAKSYKIIFEILKSENLIEIVDVSQIFDKSIDTVIHEQIKKDIVQISKVFPGKVSIEDDPNNPDVDMILIDGMSYCPPILWSLYMSLALSRALDSQCLFNSQALHYFRYKFGAANIPREINSNYLDSYKNIFNSFLPNEPLLPNYVVEERQKCDCCVNLIKCSDSYLIDLEKNLKKYLEWRNYDEINQLKELADSVIKRNEIAEEFIDPEKILDDFYNKEKIIKKRVRVIFPQIKRWSNFSTILSIPLAVFGLATQNPLLAISSAGVAGASQMTNELIKLLESKYKWINLLPSTLSKSAEVTK
ncbi:MAG: hypothetical protein M0P61_14075 [Ignavibacteriaceae bacterium]|jgi:hypothetical protein|nr:hypothetical protein [Ignavibacteriaceae bacterium]